MYLLQDLVVIIIIQILQNNWYKTIENAAVIILNILTADWLVELQKIVVLDRLKFQIVFIVKFLCKSIGICNWYFNCIHCFGISCFFQYFTVYTFSALTLLVVRQEGHPACKNRVVGCWCGCLSGARCRLAYGPADTTATQCLLPQ